MCGKIYFLFCGVIISFHRCVNFLSYVYVCECVYAAVFLFLFVVRLYSCVEKKDVSDIDGFDKVLVGI